MKPETAYKLVKMVNYIHLLKQKKEELEIYEIKKEIQ